MPFQFWSVPLCKEVMYQAVQTHIIAIHIRHMYSSLLQCLGVVMTFGGYHANAICSHHGSTDNLFTAIYSAYIHVCTPNNISWLQASARHKYTFIIHIFLRLPWLHANAGHNHSLYHSHVQAYLRWIPDPQRYHWSPLCTQALHLSSWAQEAEARAGWGGVPWSQNQRWEAGSWPQPPTLEDQTWHSLYLEALLWEGTHNGNHMR